MTEASVKDLLGELGDQGVPPRDAKERLGQRARMVQHLERLDGNLRTRDVKRARLYRVLLGVSAAAACVLMGIGLHVWLLDPTVDGSVHVSVVDGTVDVGEHRQGVQRDVELGRGDSVKTHKLSNARLRLDSGAQVQLAASSEARFGADGPREQVTLLRGSVAVRVPKLPEGASLGVATFDTKVEVHGTEFTVAVENSGERRWTRVEVREGVVSVKSGQHELFLTAPSRWVSAPVKDTTSPGEPAAVSESDATPPATNQAAPGPREPAADQPRKQPSVDSRVGEAKAPSGSGSVAQSERATSPGQGAPDSATTEPDKVSTLAEQNEQFAQAKAALHGADPERGIAALERFVQSYPKSMHVESALVERMRALSELGRRREAARAAQRYLASYPNGFAREEAQRLALDEP